MTKNIFVIIFLLLAFTSRAQNNTYEFEEKDSTRQPVVGVYSITLGHKVARIDYLSPLSYSGLNLGIEGSWSKALPFDPEHAVMQFDGAVNFSSLLNPARTAKMVGLDANFSWDIDWRARLRHNLQIRAGGGIDIKGGAYYLLRNSNNPVEAIANASLMLTASASWHFNLGKVPVLVADRVKLPFIGAFFCPQYGETYYEIYLGNHEGLAHCGWWGNNFRISNLLSVTLDLGKTALMLGYSLEAYNQWANHLNSKIITNSFVIGVIPNGIGLKRHKTNSSSSEFYSIY